MYAAGEMKKKLGLRKKDGRVDAVDSWKISNFVRNKYNHIAICHHLLQTE